MRAAYSAFGGLPAPEDSAGIDRVLAALCARVAVLEAKLEALTVTGSVTQPPEPVAAKVEELKTACRELAIMVSWDSHVTEPAAAQLLGKAPTTLRNWRDQHRPLPFRKLGGRVQYDLADLAAYIVNEPPETA
jgi:hypothetical protein